MSNTFGRVVDIQLLVALVLERKTLHANDPLTLYIEQLVRLLVFGTDLAGGLQTHIHHTREGKVIYVGTKQ